MTSTISAREARDNFTDLLGSVFYANQTITIQKKGRPVAVVLNPTDYQSLKNAAKASFFTVVNQLQKNTQNQSPATVQQDIDAAVQTVRQNEPKKE